MRRITKVSIRQVNDEWQIATTFGGLYNPIAYRSTKEEAEKYAKSRGWKVLVENKC